MKPFVIASLDPTAPGKPPVASPASIPQGNGTCPGTTNRRPDRGAPSTSSTDRSRRRRLPKRANHKKNRLPRVTGGSNQKAGAAYSLGCSQYHRREELNYRVRNGNGCDLSTVSTPKIFRHLTPYS